jgi:hypothetical protein
MLRRRRSIARHSLLLAGAVSAPRRPVIWALILAAARQIMSSSSAVFGLLRYRLGRMPEHDRTHIQFRRATLVRSFTGTLIYAAAVIAAPVSPVAALAMVVFVPAMFNIPILLQHYRQI